jgi:hypothetical protein
MAALILLVASLPAAAQGRWKEIGKTAAGNTISLDPKSLKTVNGVITGLVEVHFTEPVKTPKGNWKLSRHTMMFDCAKKTVAAKQSTYYSDEAGTKVVDKNVISKPGFGPAIGGSMTAVALEYVCAPH